MQDDTYFDTGHVADSAAEARGALSRRLKNSQLHHIVDQTGIPPRDVAIYGLPDPREVRYVGQTRSPLSRHVQHIRRYLEQDLALLNGEASVPRAAAALIQVAAVSPEWGLASPASAALAL